MTKKLKRVSLLCMAAGLFSSFVPALAEGEAPEGRGDMIAADVAHYAITIRGGASKGAYEAGLNRGILDIAGIVYWLTR